MKSFLLNKQRERSTLIMNNRVKEIWLSRCDAIISTPTRTQSTRPLPLLTYGHRGHILVHAFSLYWSWSIESSIEYFNRELCAMLSIHGRHSSHTTRNLFRKFYFFVPIYFLHSFVSNMPIIGLKLRSCVFMGVESIDTFREGNEDTFERNDYYYESQ